jgi:Holliday junction resolvase RusA-like endonuclease
MPDMRKSDLSNKIESINDMLVKYWLLADDNREIISELKVSCNWVDRTHPRCEIDIYSLIQTQGWKQLTWKSLI